jgi:hypothetical protein
MYVMLYIYISGCSKKEKSEKDINILVIHAVYINEAGDREEMNIDYMCGDKATKKHDSWFVLLSVHKFFSTDFFKSLLCTHIYIWSDGGSHHFKNVYTQYMFTQLLLIHAFDYMEWNFFASYHGHNACDRHAAHIKQNIKKIYIQSEGERRTGISSINWGPANVQQLVDMLTSHHIPHTQYNILPQINRTTSLNMYSIPKTKTFHQYIYQKHNPNTVLCKHLSNDNDPQAQFTLPFKFKIQKNI